MTAMLRGLLTVLFVAVTIVTASAADRTMIILDASGSMWGQINGKPKLEIARETLRNALMSLPVDREIGLMAYGHREKGSCEDIEVVVPPAAGTAGAISAAADQMKFLGKTPLTAAVRQAAETLRYTEDKAKVILITDGLETCNADPCALGKELEAAGIDFTVDVVGFGLTADEGKQVSCLAENTGGKYIQASDAAQLKDALAETVVAAPAATPAPSPAPAPEPAPAPQPAAPEFNLVPTVKLSQAGPNLAKQDDVSWVVSKANPDGSKGDYVSTDYGSDWKGQLEAGDYILTAKMDYAEVDQPVKIEAGKTAEPQLVLNAGTLIIHPYASKGGEISSDAAVNVRFDDDGDTTDYGKLDAVFPAGDLKVKVTIGAGETELTIPLKAGEIVEKDVVVGVGRVVINALYAVGADKVETGSLDTRIFKAKVKIDGTRDQVAYGFEPEGKFDLPYGDYVAVVRFDQAEIEQPFSVKVGDQQTVTVILNAGVLSITAPGARNIEVFSAKKDIQGERKAFGSAYDEKHQTTLPAGYYVIVATRGDPGVKTEATATVKAGERAEVTVP